MKKVLGLFMVIILSGTVASAQGNAKNQRRDRKPRMGRDSISNANRMATTLKLDEKQIAELRKLNESFAEKAKTEREAMRAEREQQREKRLAMREERMAEVKKILTEEQYQEYAKLHQQRGNRLKGDGERQPADRNQRPQRERRHR